MQLPLLRRLFASGTEEWEELILPKNCPKQGLRGWGQETQTRDEINHSLFKNAFTAEKSKNITKQSPLTMHDFCNIPGVQKNKETKAKMILCRTVPTSLDVLYSFNRSSLYFQATTQVRSSNQRFAFSLSPQPMQLTAT